MPFIARAICVAAVLVLARPAGAWLREPYEDAQVVARSDLIVVGRLKADSIKYVPHVPRNPDDGRSWEHHATLVVTDVIAGDAKPGELAVVIHYGITPVVGGTWKQGGVSFNVRDGREDYPPGRIELYDHGNSSFGIPRTVEDAAQDNLWFLRRGLKNSFDAERPAGAVGISDPEDVQPLALRSYFERYRARDAEAAIREYVRQTPGPRESALRYLDHLEVRRIAAMPDASERAGRLVPFFLRDARWGLADEAGEALAQCGDAAGDELLEIFDRPEHARSRERIIRTWGRLRYRPAVPALVDLLERHDQFWAEQALEPGWWNDDKYAQRSVRQKLYGEVYRAIIALGAIGDPAARRVVDQTRTRWRPLGMAQLTEACDKTLAEIAANEPGL